MMRVLFALLLSMASYTAHARPQCTTDSDPDGDGWGWEHGQSCVMPTSSTIQSCIDSDGDGWGWDGEKSCIVSAAPPILSHPLCEDTGILNDTWGWDGTRSCRIAPELTGGNTSTIAGLWNASSLADDTTRYLAISTDGVKTVYSQKSPSDCFTIGSGIQSEEGAVLTPLGGNTYRTDAFILHSSFDLERLSYTSIAYIDMSGALRLEQTDHDDLDGDGDRNELVSLSLHTVNNTSEAELPVCATL